MKKESPAPSLIKFFTRLQIVFLSAAGKAGNCFENKMHFKAKNDR